MTEKTLLVSAIKEGTVIDHILSGMGLKIIRLLKLAAQRKQVSVGLNLKSKSMGYKDLIKVEDLFLTESQAAQIAIFSPKTTVNVIQNYKVSKKFIVQFPDTISAVFSCANPHCITQTETIATEFNVEETPKGVFLECLYCEKIFSRDEVQERKL